MQSVKKRVQYTTFGKLVNASLEVKGMQKIELAEAIGISPAYLTDILKGTRDAAERKQQIIKHLELEQTIQNGVFIWAIPPIEM